ncbi:hypothetical protein [Immundisolibacter sp.]
MPALPIGTILAVPSPCKTVPGRLGLAPNGRREFMQAFRGHPAPIAGNVVYGVRITIDEENGNV